MSIERKHQKIVRVDFKPSSLAGKREACDRNTKTLARIQGGVRLSEGESYVPLFRSLLNHRYMTDANKFQFWVWCLLKATYKERKVLVGSQTVNLQPGQFIFGRKSAAKELGTTEQSIRTLVKFFLAESNPKLTIKSTNKFSIITVVNYTTYIDKVKTVNQQSNQQVTSDQPAPNHKQEGKRKKKNKTSSNFCLPEWVPADDWAEFVEMRREMKKPLTDRAKAMAVKELEKLKTAGSEPGAVLRQSVLNSWRGLFEVKGQQRQSLHVVGGNNPNFVGGHWVK